MAPEKALPAIVQLVNQSTFANASRYMRIIRVEKVIPVSLSPLFLHSQINAHFCLYLATNPWAWYGTFGYS